MSFCGPQVLAATYLPLKEWVEGSSPSQSTKFERLTMKIQIVSKEVVNKAIVCLKTRKGTYEFKKALASQGLPVKS